MLLRDVSKRGLVERQVRWLIELVIAAVLLAGTFRWGCAYALYALLQTIAPAPTNPDKQAWITVIALIITSLGYLPLDHHIRRRLTLDHAASMGPRRGLVLVLLGAGVLAFAIGVR